MPDTRYSPVRRDTGPPTRRVFVFLGSFVLRVRPESQGLARAGDSRKRFASTQAGRAYRGSLFRNNKSPAAFPLIRHVWGAMAMAKDPIPIPEPDVVRPPTPSEAPTPDVVNIPEPAPDWEPSPLPSIIPPGFPEEAPKEAPPAGRGRAAQRERRRPRRRGYPAVEGAKCHPVRRPWRRRLRLTG